MALSAENSIIPGFDAERLRAAMVLGDWAQRERLFEQYRKAPMPDARSEEWRRTDPEWFPWPRLSYRPARGWRITTEPADEADLAIDFHDDGIVIRDPDRLLASGQVVVGPPGDEPNGPENLIWRAEQLGSRSAVPHKLAWLARAFWSHGLAVRIAERSPLRKGIRIRHRYESADTAFLPFIRVIAGPGARVALWEEVATAADASLLVAVSRDACAQAGAELTWVLQQSCGRGAFYLSDDRAQGEREARINWLTLNIGGAVAKMNLTAEVAGPGATAQIEGLYLAGDHQHMDQRILQIHSAPHSTSNLLYKGAVKDRARSVYQGVIVARPGAVKVDAYQRNNNIVLSEEARADSLPGLEIDTDDLKCSHGATVGTLDEEQLFYLRSRGLAAREARRMLLRGFFEEVLGRVPIESVRASVEAYMDEHLAEV